MKVRLLGGWGGKCPGLQTSSTVRARAGARAAEPPWPLLAAESPSCHFTSLGGLNLDPFGHMSGFAPAASVSELAVLVSAAKTRDQSFKPRDRFEVRPRKKVLNAQASVKQLRLLQL